MPSSSKKQQRFFGLVRAVQKGEKPASEVSPELRKVANSISSKDASDFASSIAELKTKKAVLAILKEIQQPMYLEEGDSSNALAKEFNVKDNYASYISRFLGQPFTQKELDAVQGFEEAKPVKIERTQIVYEKSDEFKNSVTVTIKKMKDGGQLSFNAFTKHTQIEPDKNKEEETPEATEPESNGPGAPAPEPSPDVNQAEDEGKDDILISKSVLFKDDIEGAAVLAGFLSKLDI